MPPYYINVARVSFFLNFIAHIAIFFNKKYGTAMKTLFLYKPRSVLSAAASVYNRSVHQTVFPLPAFGISMRLCTTVFASLCFSALFFSCASFRGRAAYPSVVIADKGIKTSASLTAFFLNEVDFADKDKVRRLANLYIQECALEGINSDIAFAQMCLETGFLRFGGLVSEDMYNFCGLGAIDENERGCRFESESEGVRAHVQHLKAYGSTEALVMPPVDPRYKWVTPKGKAPSVYLLSGTWAADPSYGNKLAGILERMAAF